MSLQDPIDHPPTGLFAAVPTFFKPEHHQWIEGTLSTFEPTVKYVLDFEAQLKHANFLADRGIDGLTLFSPAGEGAFLARHERNRLVTSLADAMRDSLMPRMPLLVCAAGSNAEEITEELYDAKSSGAQWGMVRLPAKTDQLESPVDWILMVAERSPMPIIVDWETLMLHENIVGCNIETGDTTIHAQVALSPVAVESPLRFAVYAGLASTIVPALAVGCTGVIDAMMASCFPRVVSRLWKLAARAQNVPSCLRTYEHQRRASRGLWHHNPPTASPAERDELRDLQFRVAQAGNAFSISPTIAKIVLASREPGDPTWKIVTRQQFDAGKYRAAPDKGLMALEEAERRLEEAAQLEVENENHAQQNKRGRTVTCCPDH